MHIHRPRTIADAVGKIARQAAGRDWDLYAGLLAHWPEIVGAEYSKVSSPVKIAFPYQKGEARRKGGSLTVRLPKGLAMEFSFKADLIRQRVNAYMGYDAFAKVVLEPSTSIIPEKQAKQPDIKALETFKAKASEIEDPELRAVLESFGRAMAGYD